MAPLVLTSNQKENLSDQLGYAVKTVTDLGKGLVSVVDDKGVRHTVNMSFGIGQILGSQKGDSFGERMYRQDKERMERYSGLGKFWHKTLNFCKELYKKTKGFLNRIFHRNKAKKCSEIQDGAQRTEAEKLSKQMKITKKDMIHASNSEYSSYVDAFMAACDMGKDQNLINLERFSLDHA